MPNQPNPFSATHEELLPAHPASHRNWIVVMLIVGTLVLLAAIMITAVLAFVAGGIVGQSELYHQRATEQAAQMRSYLSSQGERFAEVEINEASSGWSYLSGTVDSQADFDQLQAEMQRLFGEELGSEMTRIVEVREEPAQSQADD